MHVKEKGGDNENLRRKGVGRIIRTQGGEGYGRKDKVGDWEGGRARRIGIRGVHGQLSSQMGG
jgi:hypothetical protein